MVAPFLLSYELTDSGGHVIGEFRFDSPRPLQPVLYTGGFVMHERPPFT
jgi:hypothetical protein